MTKPPVVAIGVPTYNGRAHVAEAVESLLTQTHSDFQLVIIDDCSDDGTDELIAQYAAEDSRVHFTRNTTRIGQSLNGTRVLEIASDLKPGLEYFAWASDHDAWHPRWLEALLSELEANSEAVLAYPLVATVRQGAQAGFRYDTAFDTTGVEDPVERATLTWEAGAFGSRAYGLFRMDALARSSFALDVYISDRFLLVELAAHGPFRQVPEVLWYRRKLSGSTYEGQREAFFVERRAPLIFRLPWPHVHSAALFWSLAVRGRAPMASRRQGARIARRYLAPARAEKARQEAAIRAAEERAGISVEAAAQSVQ